MAFCASLAISFTKGKNHDFLVIHVVRDRSVDVISIALSKGKAIQEKLREYSMGLLLHDVSVGIDLHIGHPDNRICDHPSFIKDSTMTDFIIVKPAPSGLATKPTGQISTIHIVEPSPKPTHTVINIQIINIQIIREAA